MTIAMTSRDVAMTSRDVVMTSGDVVMTASTSCRLKSLNDVVIN